MVFLIEYFFRMKFSRSEYCIVDLVDTEIKHSNSASKHDLINSLSGRRRTSEDD
ncbi:24829_t:CDS:2, partial [Gigaspora margarita]